MNDERKKFLLLGSYLFSLLPFRGDLLTAFQDLGFDVCASAAENDSEILEELADRSILYCPVRLQRDSLNPLKDALTFFDYARLFMRVRPDVVLSYTIKPIVYGIVVAAFFKVPVRVALITGLGSGFSDSASSVKRIILKFLYKFALGKCQIVFFQNDADMEYFIRETLVEKTKCFRVMGSGVNIADYSVDGYPEKVTFTMISRLLKEKGVEEFLQAAERLKKKYPDVRFKLVGWIDDGSKCVSRAALEKAVEDGYIDYLGRSNQIRSVLAETSVFVLPSYYKEGVPRTLLEALAASRAVVTTTNPGCADTVVDGWNGYLVPPRDANALELALERFVLDKGAIQEMGARSRVYAESKFDVDLVNKEIVAKVEAALSRA